MPSRRWTEGEVKRAHDMRAARRSYREIDKALGRFPAERSKGLKLQATDRGIACTSHRATFQITFWPNATRLRRARATCGDRAFLWRSAARLLGAETARQDCADAAGIACVLILPQQFRQLRHVGRDPPRQTAAEQL